ncbi:MAG TPA: oligosaccharide flippase family protein, partial [Methylocella sp.]|nr:oligosaccharide flippase family protein [Methylocella sp.]
MPPSLWVTIEKFMQQVIWLLLFVILARILGPRPYGQFAIVMVFISCCEIVLVESTVEALLGMEPLQPMHLRTANLCTLSLSILAGCFFYLLAPLIGLAFGDAELGPIFQTLSVLPTISALTSAPVAVLRSQLRFRPLAIRSTLGLTIGGICGLALALRGAGVWALVAQVIVQRAAEVIILWSSAHTRFGIGWSRPHFVELRHFATHLFVSRGLSFAGGQIPRLILGFFLGASDLGLFVFAARLPDMLALITLAPTTLVARSTLRQYSPGQKELEKAFGQLLQNTAFFAYPICTGAAAIIPLFIVLALDSRWHPAILAAQLMILSVIPWMVYYGASAVLLAMKYPREEAKISVGQVLSTTLCLLLAAPFGLNIVCFVLMVRYVALMPLPLWLIRRKCGIGLRPIVRAIGPSFIASAIMGSIVALASPFVAQRLSPIAALPVLIGLGVIIYAALAGILARQGALQGHALEQFLVNGGMKGRASRFSGRKPPSDGKGEGLHPDAVSQGARKAIARPAWNWRIPAGALIVLMGAGGWFLWTLHGGGRLAEKPGQTPLVHTVAAMGVISAAHAVPVGTH